MLKIDWLGVLVILVARASLIAQLVKNLPAIQETLVRFLGQKELLEKGLATHSSIGVPLWLSWWRICLQYWRPGFSPWVGKISWRRERLPTAVFWPGEFHSIQYSPWGCKESDTAEWLSLHLIADELTEYVCVCFWTLAFHSVYFSYAYSMILITRSWNKVV